MSDQASGMSSVKLGFAVGWPAFWTGVPIKFVIVLLFLAMGVHPWEGTGLAFLLLLSIPIDIWALGLVSKTVFLERLRREPPGGLGVTLWWQGALLTVPYLGAACFIERWTVTGAKAATHWVLAFFPSLPIAEKISIELVLWGSVATVVLMLLILGWLFLYGLVVKRQVRAASASGESYQGLIRRWDLLRVPADQPLLLTVFAGIGILVVLCFWGFMPVTTPHPHEDYEFLEKTVKAVKPAEAMQKVENVMAQAEVAIEKLEKKAKKSR